MRNRRRIFNIIDQLDFLYKIKAVNAGYISGPHAEQKQLYLRTLVDQQLLLRKLNEMYDFELFVKALTALNKAYVEDLRTERVYGDKTSCCDGESKTVDGGESCSSTSSSS